MNVFKDLTFDEFFCKRLSACAICKKDSHITVDSRIAGGQLGSVGAGARADITGREESVVC